MTAEVEPDIYDKFTSLSPPPINSCRLSIRDKVFRKVINGEEEVLGRGNIKLVIVKTAPISRMYYSEQYGTSGSTTPTCWSTNCNTGVPSPNVLPQNKQNVHCFDCKQNIKGSGSGHSLACGFKQRLAVILLDANDNLDNTHIFRLDVPSNSIFPKDPKKMSLRTYAKVLNTNKTALAALLTEVEFDDTVSVPKLLFKPARALERSELEIAYHVQKDEDTLKLVKLDFKPRSYTPINTDNVFEVVQGEGVYTRKT